MTARHYLDWNATAPLRPEALAALQAALAETGNPSSVHASGRSARRRVEDARIAVAALAGGDPERLVFTGGGTEANNLAILGQRAPHILVSGIEHDAVLSAAHSAGVPVRRIRATRDGIVDLDHLTELLCDAPTGTLVAVMLANNETGAIQPVSAVADMVHAAGGVLHCDAVQAAGKIGISAASLAADTVALSAHKIGGPQGVGALLVSGPIDLLPVLRGGGQERGLRAGTENVAGIAAFGAAATAALAGLSGQAGVMALRDHLQAAMVAVAPEAVVHAANVSRLPNTLCIALPGALAETQVMAMDLAGIAVSAGSACSSGKVRPSHVLTAMGWPEPAAREAIRLSLGWSTDEAAVAAAADAYAALAARRRSRAA
jgi:cysteine desulfurase